ncbi:MAG: PhzF family phenazine biosynthesis protein, partial [Clostridium sp.]
MKIYQVDAFAEEIFKGNPAAVCPLDKWLPSETMQKIAAENNLSETAFFVKVDNGYELRWFTPEFEINLCGHATLASAYVIFNYIETEIKEISFKTLSGELKVNRDGDLISMVFPRFKMKKGEVCERLIEAMGVIPVEVYEGRDLMVVLQSEDDINYLNPNMAILKELDFLGVMVTSKGKEVDFVSRFFVPSSVIQEDPVTGSAHCALVPYWSRRLNKDKLIAKQLSKRGGTLICESLGELVKMSGFAKLYLEGYIY